MKNKIFNEFIGPRIFRIFVSIHICYLLISQFTKFEDLLRRLEGWDTGQRKMRKGRGGGRNWEKKYSLHRKFYKPENKQR